MKRKICSLIIIIGFFLVVGIVGGVDNGQPLSNVWWCFPVLFVMWVLARVGRLFEIGE